MNWKDFWNKQASDGNPDKQVGRINSGSDNNSDYLGKIIEHIKLNLELKSSDRLLDLCCGNGMITKGLSGYVKDIKAFDISEIQIENAKKFNASDNIKYAIHDIQKAFNEEELFDKINLYFSFQYIESFEAGFKVIQNLVNVLKPGGIIFLGDIPDKEREQIYYSTFRKKLRKIKQDLTGKNDMGKFWSKKEMDSICQKLKVQGTYKTEPSNFLYASYRFDYIIKKADIVS